jgi:hypothetical protein
MTLAQQVHNRREERADFGAERGSLNGVPENGSEQERPSDVDQERPCREGGIEQPLDQSAEQVTAHTAYSAAKGDVEEHGQR